MVKTDSGQTSDGYTNRQHGSCVWINLLRSMYGEFLRYFESRFQSHEGIFLIRKADKSGLSQREHRIQKRDVLDLLKNLFSTGALEKRPSESLSFAPVRSQITSPASRQTPDKYNEISDNGKSIFAEMELSRGSRYTCRTDDT